jgi:hypothetical protein
MKLSFVLTSLFLTISWDSAFIAIGKSRYNQDQAQEELRTLFQAQWKNGLVPHIVFNPNTSR